MSAFRVSDLLSFEKVIATKVMKLVYLIGMIGIAIAGVVAFLGSFGAMQLSSGAGLLTMLLSVVGTALALLIWRVVCELWILGFKIYERLAEIRDNVGVAAPPRP